MTPEDQSELRRIVREEVEREGRMTYYGMLLFFFLTVCFIYLSK